MKHTINKSKEIVYVAKNFALGLTDVVLTVRKPDGTTLSPAVTEQSGGIYIASYTPDVTGVWQEKIESASNGDKVIRSYQVVNYDVDDLHSQVDGVETKVDTANGKIDTIDGKADSIEGKVDTVSGKADSIETKIDALDVDVSPGGYFA